MSEQTGNRERFYPIVRVLGESHGVGAMQVVSVHNTKLEALETFMALPDKRGLAVFPRPFRVEPKPGGLHPFEPGQFREMDRALRQAEERTRPLSELEPPKPRR